MGPGLIVLDIKIVFKQHSFILKTKVPLDRQKPKWDLNAAQRTTGKQVKLGAGDGRAQRLGVLWQMLPPNIQVAL